MVQKLYPILNSDHGAEYLFFDLMSRKGKMIMNDHEQYSLF